jgi:dephospho-CoA kinase
MILGVTSCMGCGASTVTKMLKAKGAKVVSADEIAGELLKKPAIKIKLAKAFGKEIIVKKKVDRKKLAELAFESKISLKKLNDITHPPILREIKQRLGKLKKSRLVVLDAPLLVESGLVKNVDKLILVRASRETQLKRLMQKNVSREQALKRIKAHYSLTRKAKQADYFIDNNGSLKDTREQLNAILEELEVMN